MTNEEKERKAEEKKLTVEKKEKRQEKKNRRRMKIDKGEATRVQNFQLGFKIFRPIQKKINK